MMRGRELEILLLDVARVLVAEGTYPSLDQLTERTGYSAKGRVCEARRALVARGVWPVKIKPTTNAAAVESNLRRFRARWADPNDERISHLVGLNGRTPEEIAEAEANARQVRAENLISLPLLPVLSPTFTFGDLAPRAASRVILRKYHRVVRATEVACDVSPR